MFVFLGNSVGKQGVWGWGEGRGRERERERRKKPPYNKTNQNKEKKKKKHQENITTKTIQNSQPTNQPTKKQTK